MLTEGDQYELVRQEARELGFAWFEGLYNLNVVGLRAPADGTNLFDDRILVAYQDEKGRPRVESWAATTDPGRKSMDHPIHPRGTFTMAPGQVRGMWTKGLHKGKYEALVQRPGKEVPGWRGTDRTLLHYDARGINCHHGAGASRVDWYSMGCQVLCLPAHLRRLLELYDLQVKVRGPKAASVTYTLHDVEHRTALAPLLAA